MFLFFKKFGRSVNTGRLSGYYTQHTTNIFLSCNVVLIWCFTPRQPVRLYQGDNDQQEDRYITVTHLHPPQTVQDLRQAVVQEWQNVSRESLRRHYPIHKDGCQAVIDARGRHTQYRTLSFSKWPYADRSGEGNHPWQWYHLWLVSVFEKLSWISTAQSSSHTVTKIRCYNENDTW